MRVAILILVVLFALGYFIWRCAAEAPIEDDDYGL